MDLNDFKNLDISDVSKLGNAPLAVKAILMLLVLATVLGAGYYFHSRNQLEDLKQLAVKEQDLRRSFDVKYKKSANIKIYQAQLKEMEEDLGAMLRQLPSGTEIPAVILDVSQTGLASGLKINLFKPQNEVTKGFYAEKPIQIRVTGDYHQMAKFSSGIAALPRIVTLHNIKLSPTSDNKLSMDVTAKTYRYLADQEDGS
ncbi:MAG TPA: pilus assembly protein PilO [Gammaproteobacteria bacterium]|jgi:type IV pilus assembly protein PilO|nr:pilus assembly protein PilO [Gammaproteobacteria bacterium]